MVKIYQGKHKDGNRTLKKELKSERQREQEPSSDKLIALWR